VRTAFCSLYPALKKGHLALLSVCLLVRPSVPVSVHIFTLKKHAVETRRFMVTVSVSHPVYANFILSLLLLAIMHANHMFNIFTIKLLSFMTSNLVKSLVFSMFSSVHCLSVPLLLIFCWLPEMMNKDKYICIC